MNEAIAAVYRTSSKAAREQLSRYTRKGNGISFIRLSILLGGGTLLFKVVQTESVLGTLLVFLGTVISFLFMVRFQSQISAKRKRAEDRLAINQNELNVLQRKAENLYDSGIVFLDEAHLYTADLDIFGKGSLFHMVNRCATPSGNQRLANWLMRPAGKEEILLRQDFISELSEDISWWQELQLRLFPILGQSKDIRILLKAFLSTRLPFPETKLLRYYTWAVPFISLGLLTFGVFLPRMLPVVVAFGIFNLLLSLSQSKQVSRHAESLHKGGALLQAYVPALEQIEGKAWKNAFAVGMLKQIATRSGMPVSASIARLSTLLGRLDARLNVLVGTLLNAYLLWDFRQVYALRAWQRLQSEGIMESIENLGTVEALGSLAVLNFNHPSWCMPKISSQADQLKVTEIRHPLLDEDKAVASDYEMQEHRIALITGSNMAGKSTFLRTIGINAVLAFAGGPVCAGSMVISVMQIASYMRIRDSLNENTSTFRAELNRIQKILNLVETTPNAYFLLDEMLRGTNSMDKYLGSKAIIEKLISLSGTGMVATHDLKLAELSENYPAVVRNFHFDIQVVGEQMQFDYKLKQGPCTTFNASLLLKKIGIYI